MTLGLGYNPIRHLKDIDKLLPANPGMYPVVVDSRKHGGDKCASQLVQVLEGGLKMKVIKSVQITIPRDYITGVHRVGMDTGMDSFLDSYAPQINNGFEMLLS